MASCCCLCQYCVLLHIWSSFRPRYGLQTRHGCRCKYCIYSVFDQNIILFDTLVTMVNFFCLQGIWIGMLTGTVIQTLVLFWMVYRTNWNKEVIITSNKVIFCKQFLLIVYSVYTHWKLMWTAGFCCWTENQTMGRGTRWQSKWFRELIWKLSLFLPTKNFFYPTFSLLRTTIMYLFGVVYSVLTSVSLACNYKGLARPPPVFSGCIFQTSNLNYVVTLVYLIFLKSRCFFLFIIISLHLKITRYEMSKEGEMNESGCAAGIPEY